MTCKDCIAQYVEVSRLIIPVIIPPPDIPSLILATCADGVESLCSILMAPVAPIVLASPPIQATRRLASNLVRLCSRAARQSRCSP